MFENIRNHKIMIFAKRIFAPDICLRLRSLLRFFNETGSWIDVIFIVLGVHLWSLINTCGFLNIIYEMDSRHRICLLVLLLPLCMRSS